jgi:hypothetical protein
MANPISYIISTIKTHQHKLWFDIIKEIGILTILYEIYALSRGSLATKTSAACQHALDIIDLEKAMGIFVELDIQDFFLGNFIGPDIANTMYTFFYYPTLIMFGIWAYWRHRPKFKILRTTFVISAALAFVVFALYPVAPPRFFDGAADPIRCGIDLGFVDTLPVYWNANDIHQGWTLMVGAGIIWMTKAWWGRLIGATIPIAMFMGIVSTGNHFILDAVGGIIAIAIAFGLTVLILKKLGKYNPQGNESVPADTHRLSTVP